MKRSLSQKSLTSTASFNSDKHEASNSPLDVTGRSFSSAAAADIEAPGAPSPTEPKSLADDDSGEMIALSFHETNEIVYVPLSGQVNNSETVSTRRCVPNGCAICLSTFSTDERLTWSSNPECSHIFHFDCVIHWFLSVGRKFQKNQLRQRPEMSENERLDIICKFPMLCPCWRQSFCIPIKDDNNNNAEAGSSSSSEQEPQEENESGDMADSNTPDNVVSLTSGEQSSSEADDDIEDGPVGIRDVEIGLTLSGRSEISVEASEGERQAAEVSSEGPQQ